jgi:exopolyphosphatase/guanosine-5'-triphosphate,3'-diphosphate pyrophosphatase
MHRVAVIDCGTNTFNLLIADVNDGKIRFRKRTKRVVKLGSAGIGNNFIGDLPFERGISALKEYSDIIKKAKVDAVLAVATSAIRDAKNKNSFVKAAKNRCGLNLKCISGEKEAALITKGVHSALKKDDKTSLILDIGGGSVEFIICKKGKILWKNSYRLGAARLIEAFPLKNKVSKSVERKTEAHINSVIVDFFDAFNRYNPEQLIGSSGSFETFQSILSLKDGQKPNYSKKIQSLDVKKYKILHTELLNSSYEERLQMPGMLKMRADMIAAASIIVTFVLKKTKIKDVILSNYSLKEGVLFEYLQKNKLI